MPYGSIFHGFQFPSFENVWPEYSIVAKIFMLEIYDTTTKKLYMVSL